MNAHVTVVRGGSRTDRHTHKIWFVCAFLCLSWRQVLCSCDELFDARHLIFDPVEVHLLSSALPRCWAPLSGNVGAIHRAVFGALLGPVYQELKAFGYQSISLG